MLSLLGIFAIIFISVLTFRTARDYGKNALLWTFAALAVGFGIQIIIPIIAVIIAAATGNYQPPNEPSWLFYLDIACMASGIIGAQIVLRRVSKLPDDETFTSPPPPTKFDL